MINQRQSSYSGSGLSDAEVQNRANELISKNAAFLDAPSYVRLQQALMSKVAERGVLIETLPSSNVRISQYSHIGEHHSLRWMRIPGYIEEGGSRNHGLPWLRRSRDLCG
jgi:hypothetical protein